MAQQIDVPNVGIVEFPDDMPDADIAAAIKRNYPQIHSLKQQPTGNQNMGDKIITNPGQVNMGLPPVYGDAPTQESAPMAFATHAANKVMLSQMPRLAGLLNAALPVGGEDRGLGENYARGKLNAEQELAQQATDHPIASGAGNLVGDTVPYMMNPAAGVMGKAAVSGAIGAAQGVGQGASNIDFSNDQARQAALMQLIKDGGYGAAGGVVGEGLGAGAGVLRNKLSLHALGIQKSLAKNLTTNAENELIGYATADKPSFIKDLLLSRSDQTVDNPVLGMFKSSRGSSEANAANMAQGGKLVGDTIDNVKQPVDTYDVLNELNNGRPSVATGRKGPYNNPGENATDMAQQQFIDNLPQANAPNVSLRNVQDMKTDLGDQTRFEPTDSVQSNANDANKRMWGNLKDLIEGKVNASDPTGKAAADLERGNYLYRNAKNADDLINNRIAKQANQPVDFSTKLLMGTLTGHGVDPTKIIGEAAALQAANKYGSNIATSLLDTAARSKVGMFPQLSNYFMNRGNDSTVEDAAMDNAEKTDEDIAKENGAKGKM